MSTKLNILLIRSLLICSVLFATAFSVSAQSTLYSVDFGDYSDGTIDGPTWTINTSACTLSDNNDYLRIKSGLMEGRDLDGEAVFTSSPFQISEYSDISISIALTESGSLEPGDYIHVYYILDGGSETQFATNGYLNDDFTSATASQTGLNGSTLQIVIRVNDNDDAELIRFNNITITGTHTGGADSLAVTSTVSDIACNGDGDGAVDITVTGGLSPYTYSWSNGPTTQDISNVNGGSYTVTVLDNGPTSGNGIYNDNINNNNDDDAEENASTGVNNNGGNSLTLGGSTLTGLRFKTVSVPQGATIVSAHLEVYAYSSISNDTTSFSIYGLAADDPAKFENIDYNISGRTKTTASTTWTITDDWTADASYRSPDISSVVQEITDRSGWVQDNYLGFVLMNGTGGRAIYSRNGSDPMSAILVIVYSNGQISKVKSYTVDEPTALSLTGSVTNDCSNTNSGAIDITPSGGTTPYTYSWSNGETTQDLSGIAKGTYDLTITDDNGCSLDTSFEIIGGPYAYFTKTNVYCPSDCSGALETDIVDGEPPFTFSWSTGASTANISNLCTGTYTVTITDGNSCQVVKSTTISEYTAFSVLFSTTNATTEGSDGNAKAYVFGGQAPYTYAWSNGGTTDSIYGLAAGSYTATVTDNNGDQVIQTMYITDDTYVSENSFIVDMGVTPQTMGNGLKPYGMIYDLINHFHVPIKWCINQDKVKDGVDFTYNGKDYKGGPFVIDGVYRTTEVDSVVNYWVGQGVEIDTTIAGIVLPVYDVINGFSTLVIDEQNENLVIPYFDNAGIPTSVYTVGLPSDLDACDDVYALPHADPDWANHGYLRDYVMNGGYIWAGCHAVSMLEGLYNPADTSEKMNFLTVNGLQCYSGSKCGFVTETHSGNPTSPYYYNDSYSGMPVMQFMGDMTPATESGSEHWYIPQTTGGWNPGAYPAITTSDGTAPSQGVKLVFGYAFDDTTNGMVMYEAGHTFDGKGAIENEVAAERAFFNFHLMASIKKRIEASISVPNTYVTDSTQSVSVTASGGTAPYSYLWSVTVPGTFGDSSAQTTTFTLGDVPPLASGQIICQITDACGKVRIVSIPIAAINEPPGRVAGTLDVSNVTCNGADDGAIDLTPHGGNAPYTYKWSTTPKFDEDITGKAPGLYHVTITDQNGCDSVMSATIAEPDSLLSTLSSTNIVCFGDGNGTVDLSVTGGWTPYVYVWDNGDSTEDLSSLEAGTYKVTVYGTAATCYTTDSATILESTEITKSATATMRTDNAAGDATATLTVSGGQTPYTFNWSSGDTTQNLTGPAVGSHTVTITDAFGCVKTQTVEVPDTVCHCVSDGLWRDGHTWLGDCAGTGRVFPDLGDDIVISGYTVTVDSTHRVGSLTIQDSTLDVSEVLLSGNGSLTVSNNLDIKTRNQGTNVKLLIDDNCSFTVNGNLIINHDGADSIVVGLNTLSGSGASLTINGNLNLNNTLTNSDKQLLILADGSSNILVTGNIVFNPDTAGNTAVITKGSSTLELKGNMSRPEAPGNYGSFKALDNSSLVLSGSSQQTLVGTHTPASGDTSSYVNLTLNNTGSYPQFVLSGSPRISGVLNFVKGNIYTGTDTVILTSNSSGAITGFTATKYVVGTLQRNITGASGTSYDFPVGTGGTTGYHKIGVTNNGLVGTSTLTTHFGPLRSGDDATFNFQSYDIHVNKINQAGMWTVDPDVQPTGGTYMVTTSLDNISDLYNNWFVVMKRPDMGESNAWSHGGGTVPGWGHHGRYVFDGYSTLSGLTGFSEFGIGTGEGGNLPIKLLSFEATYNAGISATQLKWSTAVEIDNDHFEVERSLDGVNFETVAKVDGAGNSTVQTDYSTLDENPPLGLVYYRLKQVDYDGTADYSDMVSVIVTTRQSATTVSLYPNPTQGHVHLDIETSDTRLNIFVLNSLGSVVQAFEVENTGEGTLSTDLNFAEGLPAGQYFIRISGTSSEVIEKLVLTD